MSIKIAYSEKSNLDEALLDLQNQAKDIDPNFILFFSSSQYDNENVGKSFKDTFKNSEIMGCTTAGEIVSGKMLKNSMVAMFFDENTIDDFKIEVVENVNTNDLSETSKSFSNYFNKDFSELEFDKYIGMILIDGLSLSEEKIMDKLGDLTNVLFVGGSAGDDLKFDKTFVYHNEKAYLNAAILTLIKPKNGFDVIKTQSFVPTDKKLVATKVNEEKRQVIEFNNKPAPEAYAEALGVSIDELPKHFIMNPIGLVIGNDVYIRSPQQIKDDSILFYCNIKEGMETYILESTNILEETESVIKNKMEELGHIEGLVNFNCLFRTLELEAKNITKEYGHIFNLVPTIGFSTYGEEYLGHINQTATMILFK